MKALAHQGHVLQELEGMGRLAFELSGMCDNNVVTCCDKWLGIESEGPNRSQGRRGFWGFGHLVLHVPRLTADGTTGRMSHSSCGAITDRSEW